MYLKWYSSNVKLIWTDQKQVTIWISSISCLHFSFFINSYVKYSIDRQVRPYFIYYRNRALELWLSWNFLLTDLWVALQLFGLSTKKIPESYSFAATIVNAWRNEKGNAISSVFIPPANEVAGVYSDLYVRSFVRPSVSISNPLLL